MYMMTDIVQAFEHVYANYALHILQNSFIKITTS